MACQAPAHWHGGQWLKEAEALRCYPVSVCSHSEAPASLTPTSICAGQTTAASETNEAASGRQIRASSARGARVHLHCLA